jgi:hypothetical protein
MTQEAEDLKSEAKELLNKMFKFPFGYSSGAVEKIVDCIVSAAVLEVAEIQKQTIYEVKEYIGHQVKRK